MNNASGLMKKLYMVCQTGEAWIRLHDLGTKDVWRRTGIGRRRCCCRQNKFEHRFGHPDLKRWAFEFLKLNPCQSVPICVKDAHRHK